MYAIILKYPKTVCFIYINLDVPLKTQIVLPVEVSSKNQQDGELYQKELFLPFPKSEKTIVFP